MKTSEAGASFNFSNASVAIVDANVMCMELFANIMRGFGFRAVHRCMGLEAAAEAVKTHRVDLVLMDPFPYGERAFDFINWMRAHNSAAIAGASVLLVTAYTPVRLISTARQCGADYVVAKPFSVSTLLDRLLWVANSEGRRGEMLAPANMVSESGGGAELW